MRRRGPDLSEAEHAEETGDEDDGG